MGGSEVASGEDICAHMTWTEESGASQISCDSGYSYEGCWFGNYCIDSVNSWDSCPGVYSTMCNWDTEEWCDMGVDTNGCWMATGARTSIWVAALTSTWSARGVSWRSRKLWHTVLTLDLAQPTTADPTMAD